MASFGPGVIIVPNETDTNGGATISSTDGAFIAGGLTLGTGEVGAILSNGIFCVGDKGITTHITSIPIYNPSLSLRGTAVPFTPSSAWSVRQGMTSDYVSTFYASVPNGVNTDVRSFSDTGVTGGTTWHITNGAPLILCLSEDGSTFFYSTYNLGAQAISKWNLGSDTAGGTLIAGVAGTDWGQDMLRLPGTNQFIIIAQTAGPVFTVRRYDESGTLLKSYVLTGITHEASPTRLAIDLASSSVFWARTFNDITSATTKFWQFDVASGALLDSFTIPTDSGSPSEVPFSCPFFAWSGAPDQNVFVGTAATMPIRRERTVPIPVSTGNERQTISRLEVQFQPGTGIVDDPLGEPKFMLQVSWDHGKTWSNERLMNAGREGRYLTRAYVNIVGQGRYPVVRIVTSDTFLPIMTGCSVWITESAH
jgi:hypothetical protein